MLDLQGSLLDVVVGVVRRGLDSLVPDGKAFSLIEDRQALLIAEGLCEKFDANIRVKEVQSMSVALAAFDVIDFFGGNVPTSTEFLNNFATTIGAEIFVPARMLRDNPKSLIALLAHECEHVVQFKTQGFAMPWWYLNSSEERAAYEANAYGSGEDVQYALGWQMPARIEDIAPSLVTSYHLKADDVSLATDMLRSHMASISAGAHITKAAAGTLELVHQYAPEWIVR